MAVGGRMRALLNEGAPSCGYQIGCWRIGVERGLTRCASSRLGRLGILFSLQAMVRVLRVQASSWHGRYGTGDQ